MWYRTTKRPSSDSRHTSKKAKVTGRQPKSRMAARRVTKSAVDWAKFASLVPKNQVDCYKAFKTKSDMFSAKYDTCFSQGHLVCRSRYNNEAFII